MARDCSICAGPLAETVAKLLGTGCSIREVARRTGIPRTTLARHRQHAQVTPSRLALIRNGDGPPGPDGPLDPLAEALELSRRARSDRELLKAAEAVRSATALRVRALRGGELDREMLEQLEWNIDQAEQLYRRVGAKFDAALRGLAGVRESLRQRMEAEASPDTFEVPLNVITSDGRPLPLPPTSTPPRPMRLSAEQYWKGVPSAYRDGLRFTVKRSLKIHLDAPTEETIEVFGGDALVWAGP